MIGYWGFVVAMLILTGWHYWLTSRSMRDRDRIEATEDRAEQLHERFDQLIDWLWDVTAEPDPEPVTEPMRRQVMRTDTAETPTVSVFGPTARVLQDPREAVFEHDPLVAEVIGHADNEMVDLRARWEAEGFTTGRTGSTAWRAT